MSVEPGAMVTRNVRLCRMLGEGGMGSVWLADHLGLQTQVAVKFIAGDIVRRGGEQARARFEREAAAAARLRSPHVVRIYDHGLTDDGTPYMVMELLRGEDLDAVLEREEVLSPARLADICEPIAEALAQAHNMGIVHRDLKPGNIFLDQPEGAARAVVKLLDFGIAKYRTGSLQTATQAMLGTPLFMSPEQIESTRDVDLQADLWALAVVLYRGLCGSYPFDHDSPPKLFLLIAEGRFALPGAIDPRMSLFDGFFAKALHVDARARFGSAGELAAAFGAIARSPELADTDYVARRKTGSTGSKEAARHSSGSTAGAPPTAASQPRLAASAPATNASMAATIGDAPANASGGRPRLLLGLALGVMVAGVGAYVAVARLGGGETAPSPAGSATDRYHFSPATADLDPPPPPTASMVPSSPATTSTDAEGAPPSPRVVRARRTPSPTVRPHASGTSKGASCSPPFVIDNGVKRYKPECL